MSHIPANPCDQNAIGNGLGAAISVFNSSNAFVIENFLNEPVEDTWHQLINKTSGKLLKRVKNRFEKRGAPRVPELFDELMEKINRIVHSYRITASVGEQILAWFYQAE